MEIDASQAIKLFFPNPSLRMVYFEALTNAFDAHASRVSINIAISAFDKPETLKITITDNGEGFTDANFDRFKKLLSPADNFHKGVGRLVYLDYFDKVDIDSAWSNKKRKFTFKKDFDQNIPTQELGENQENKTSLIFTSFNKERIKSYDDLQPESLKTEIINHFLPTFDEFKRNNHNFEIIVTLNVDRSNEQKDFFSHESNINLSDIPQLECVPITNNQIEELNDIDILFHIRSGNKKTKHLIAFSIDGRTIPVSKILLNTSIPENYSVVFLFRSNSFKIKTDTSRNKIELPDNLNEAILKDTLRREVGRIIVENIPGIKKQNEETEESFEKHFPHLRGYFEKNIVGLIEKDDALNGAQEKFFSEQKKILQSENLDNKTYEKALELSSRSLTEYILYRNKIITKIREITEKDPEADIHNIIVPRGKKFLRNNLTSDVYNNNAWLLDDKFMTYSTILSEAQMRKVISAIRSDDEPIEENGRPDITIIFSADPEKEKAVDVVIIEVKRKQDNEKENQNAIIQLLNRAQKLVEYCPNIQRMWFYAIIQMDEGQEMTLRQQGYRPLFSKGKILYRENESFPPDKPSVPTPTYILSYDALVVDAEARNHTFLEILRNSLKNYSEKLIEKSSIQENISF